MSKDLKQYFSIDDYYADTSDFSVIPQKVGGEYRLLFDIYTDLKSNISISNSKLYFNLKTGGDLTMQEFTQGSASGYNHTTFYLIIPESSLDNDYLNVSAAFWSSSGRQFTISDNKGSTGLFVRSSWYNSDPMINGSSVSTNHKLDPYEKNTPFSFNYTVNDTDADDILVVKEYLDGNLIRTINNAVRNATYTIDIDKDTLYSLSEAGIHTVSISVSDGHSETTNNYKFIRTNLVPVLTVSSDVDTSVTYDKDSPQITYQAYDPEGEEITMSILVDGIIVEPKTVIMPNVDTTSSISHDNWILIKNGEHKITFLIEDAQGGQTKQDYNFIKNETVIDFQFKQPVETEVALQKYYNIISKLNVDSSSIQVLVTNNAFDDEPTWETMTTTPHVFSNATKTADKWGFNLRIIITRSTETGDIKVYGIGGSFQ